MVAHAYGLMDLGNHDQGHLAIYRDMCVCIWSYRQSELCNDTWVVKLNRVHRLSGHPHFPWELVRSSLLMIRVTPKEESELLCLLLLPHECFLASDCRHSALSVL